MLGEQEVFDFASLDSDLLIVLVHGTLIVELQGNDGGWYGYQALSSGQVLPLSFLRRLESEQGRTRVTIDRQVRLHNEESSLEFLAINKRQLSQLVFSEVKQTIRSKVQILFNLDVMGYTSGPPQEYLCEFGKLLKTSDLMQKAG